MSKQLNILFIVGDGALLSFPKAIENLNHNLKIFNSCYFKPLIKNPEACRLLTEELQTNSYDVVFSYIFIPEVSDICKKHNIKYISYTFDSPLIPAFSDAIKNGCNLTYIFDKSFANRLSLIGGANVMTTPLCFDEFSIEKLIINDEDIGKFSHDIAFVGGLYEKNTYNPLINSLNENTQNELKNYLVSNVCNWHSTRNWPILTDEATLDIAKYLGDDSKNHSTLDDNTYYGILTLSRKLAEIERITVLNNLANYFDVHLYTGSDTSNLANVNCHGFIDYHTDMYKVFNLSKINLNITLPSIETGIPQRIFDILGAGGFVMTNYQEELEDYFTLGVDLETYKDIPELIAKCRYYLTHEDARLNIAYNGFNTAHSKYSSTLVMESLLSKLQ